MNETPIALALIALIGTLAGGFFKLLGDTSKGLNKLAESGDKQAKQMGEVAKATIKAANEAEKRNGHLAEITVQQADRVLHRIDNVKEQHVDKQIVDEQQVKIETVDKVVRSKKK
jgi:hypothetical protein